MKYRLLTILIFSLTVINVSAAEEKKKKNNNYFGDDNYHSRGLKKDNKQARRRPDSLETNEKKGKERRRVRLKTDTH